MAYGGECEENAIFNESLLLLFFQSPQAGTKDKTLCCWFCTSGPISLSAKIERKGYTPGEIMLMTPVHDLVSHLLTRYVIASIILCRSAH